MVGIDGFKHRRAIMRVLQPNEPRNSDPVPAEPDWSRIDLSAFSSSGRPSLRIRLLAILWRMIGLPLLRNSPCGIPGGGYFNRFRAFWLRCFGARVGKGTVILPCEIHCPWNVQIGDYVWIGEGAWLYALAPIVIGNSVCVSQRASLCTGSHDLSDPAFGLVVGEIRLKDGCWVCAGALVAPGVTLHEGAVLGANGVAVRDLPAMTVWVGNPCRFLKQRRIRAVGESASAEARQRSA